MNRALMRPAVLLVVLATAQGLVAQTIPRPDLKREFLRLCDASVRELNGPPSRIPFYNDSYAVRALRVAYDLTSEPRYLDACRGWARRMVDFQEQMTPTGVYYMNYGRRPGQEKGGWNVADCGSIAMGVLATAALCEDAERQRLLKSVESFAKLVIDNYIGPGGGICNGGWKDFSGEWWCSSGTFGSLAFLLYNQTSDPKYLKVALRAVDWLSQHSLEEFKPWMLEEMGPTIPMYVLEAYSAGMPHLLRDPKRGEVTLTRWREALHWMAAHQESRAAASQPSATSRQAPVWRYEMPRGAKFGGLPFHMYVYARYVRGSNEIRAAADGEIDYMTRLLLEDKRFETSPPMRAFVLFSCAERLSPGSVYAVRPGGAHPARPAGHMPDPQ